MNSTPLKRLSLTARKPVYHSVDESIEDECDLIELVNQLQNKLAAGGHSLKISLPQIVVVGCQSAGKSSVLESIVGKEFLPRGSGVVTRRPAVVQLHPSDEGEEYAVFLHRGQERFTNFEDVKNEIQRETYRDPGPSGFSSQPISLKIYSPKVLKLTLVDLPGLIKNVIGDQAESSIQEVRNMVLDYIKQPNSLILAVSPANQDIANSDALNIAKEVDPERERTIGVLTKLDLMDDGTNACDILENKKIYLKRGYVGVLNRSQKDIDEERDIDFSLEKERNYFISTACYKKLANQMGTPYLRKMLNHQLKIHIKESLPAVRKELAEKLVCLRQELKEFEEKMGFNAFGGNGPQFYLIKLVQQFIEEASTQIYGHSESADMKLLSVGAIINFKLYSDLQNRIKLPPIPQKEELMVLIANIHGIRNTLNVPSQSLEAVCRHLLSLYKKPLGEFVAEMAEVIFSCMETTSKKFSMYRNLHAELMYLVESCIQQASEETKLALERHLEAEMFFVNIYHENFKMPELVDPNSIGGPVKLWTLNDATMYEPQPLNGLVDDYECPPEDSDIFNQVEQSDNIKEMLLTNQNAQKNSEFLGKMIQEYMRMERKQIGDTAIKYLLFFLLKRIMDFLKRELVPSLLEISNLKVLLAECEDDFRKRDEIIHTCNHLEEALNAVQYF